MTMRRLAAVAAVLFLGAAFAAQAQGPKFSTEVLELQTISNDSGTITVDFDGRHYHSGAGYLSIVTTNEVATASLAVFAYGRNGAGTYQLCTSGAITTETTTVLLMGTSASASAGVDVACDFPLPQNLRFTFTVVGGGASFDVRAYLDGVGPGGT